MSRKVIIVPKNKEAAQKLDVNEAFQSELIELVLDETKFNLLWENGVFDFINSVCNVNIDDFEDESITDLEKIKIIIDSLNIKNFKSNLHISIKNLLSLFEEALQRQTGVYFYF